MCYIDGQKNKYSVLNECNRMLKYNIFNSNFQCCTPSSEPSFLPLACLKHLCGYVKDWTDILTEQKSVFFSEMSGKTILMPLLQNWMEHWKITVNPSKSTQITFTTRRAICPQVSINNFPIPIKQEVKYLGLHLDKKTNIADACES
jgi:hypothetical protein